MQQFTTSTFYFDYETDAIQQFIHKYVDRTASKKEQAIQLYYAIRDGWRYNPYNITVKKEGYRASVILDKKEAHCIDKSILMVTCCRVLDIPARLCLAKVRNHIAAEKITKQFGTDELVPHGYVEVYLNNKWIKTTPVFNKELCAFINVEALEFDGETDAIFQEFDKKGGNFMEYIEDYGHYDDVPVQYMLDLMRQHYTVAFNHFLKKGEMTEADFK